MNTITMPRQPRQKRLRFFFQYTLLAGSIFSASVYAKEINVQIKVGTFSRILKINTVKLSESTLRRSAGTPDLDVIDFVEPLGSEATLPSPSSTSAPSTEIEAYRYHLGPLPLIELTLMLQNVPAYPHSLESGNEDEMSLPTASPESPERYKPESLTMTEFRYWRPGYDEAVCFPEFNQDQRFFRLSFQLPLFSIIPINHEGEPIRLTEEYFSVSFYMLFTGNTLTTLRIDHSPEETLTVHHVYRLTHSSVSNSTLEHQPDNTRQELDIPQALRADVLPPPSANSQ